MAGIVKHRERPEPPPYRDLAAGQVVRPHPGRPYMLASDPRPIDGGRRLRLWFTDGTQIDVGADERPMDVVPFYWFNFCADSPTRDHRGRRVPIATWAHADDLHAKVAELRADGYINIHWHLEAVCEETYRLCHGDRPPGGALTWAAPPEASQ